MATYNPSTLTYADLLGIADDPAAFIQYWTGDTTFVPWTADGIQGNFNNLMSLTFVGGGIDEPDGPPPAAPFPNEQVMHLQFAMGFDHFKPPSYISAGYLADWNTVIKTGRYGRGLCCRLDGYNYFAGISPGFFDVGIPLPGYFVNGDQMAAWARNDLVLGLDSYPNGYDVILPFTQRMHIYQPDGQQWVLNNLYVYFGYTYDYLSLRDGTLKGSNNITDLINHTGVLLATLPETQNAWYDLEFEQLPDTPLVPVVSPTTNPSSPRVNITFRVKVNGVVVYSEAAQSASPANFGQHMLGYVATRGALFIDNYYCAYMTQEGLPYLANSKWIIDGQEVTHDACVGAWTGYDFDTDTTFRGDYTNTVKMSNGGWIQQDVNNIVYDGGGVVTDGLYTKFTYTTDINLGTPVATYAVLLGRNYPPYGYPWILQGKTVAQARRDPDFPYLGVENSPRYTHDDLFSAVNAGRVIHQYLPTPAASGTIRIGADFNGWAGV